MNEQKEVQHFLRRFHDYEDIDDVFTRGCCYWFAQILLTRFRAYTPILMYDQIENHFGVKIDNRVYDITGDVSTQFEWEPWDSIEDSAVKQRLYRDCVMF